jgi:hypothetical protein
MRNFNRKSSAIRLSGIVTGMVVVGLIIMVALSGCKKDFSFDKVKSLTWNPYLALPLVNDSITLRRVLTQGGTEDHLDIDESGNISILFYYNNDAFRLRPADLIKLSPVSFPFVHQVTQAEQNILSISDFPIPPVIFDLNFNGIIAGARVDKLVVKKGVIAVNSNHTFSNDGYLTISILNATKNGLPFSFTLAPFVSGQAQTNIDISGVRFDMSSTPNTFQVKIEGLLKKSSRPVAGDEIRTDFQVSVDTIGWFEGFLGHQTFSQLMDTISVNVFNNAYTLGDVYFMDPQASITIMNSIGIPTDITIERLIAINNASGNTLDIANRLGAGAYFSVPSPLINATKPAIKSMNYTNDNTGNAMNDFFNLKPDNVAFQIKTEINASGTPLNFFADTSSFWGDIRVKLPLWGHFDHLTFVDTFDLVIDKPEELEFLEFRTNVSNGLPLAGLMQVYFVDENYIKKDSLTGTDQLIVREAPVDPSTELPYPGVFGVKDTTFILNTQRMQNLKYVKKALVKAVLHSSEQGQINVKLRAEQMIKLHFTAKAKLRTNIQFSK